MTHQRRTSRLTKDGQSFSSIGSRLIWRLISSGARTLASLKILRLPLLFSRHLSPTAPTAVTGLLASDRRLPDDRPRRARRCPRNARNAAEIHGFCAAVPEVRIHLPPAVSQANFRSLNGLRAALDNTEIRLNGRERHVVGSHSPRTTPAKPSLRTCLRNRTTVRGRPAAPANPYIGGKHLFG
jgi:hypothetical protein